MSNKGIITAKAVGTTVIRITASTGEQAEVAVTVCKKPSKITLNQKKLTLSTGQTAVLTATLPKGSCGAYTFTSAKPSVVTVDGNGFLTAVAPGKTSVTVKAYNGVKASCTVTVKAAPTGVSLSPAELVLGEGQTCMLTAKPLNDSIADIRLTSDHPEIASVTDSGMLTAVGCGSAVITAQSYNGHTASARVTVVPAPESIRLSVSELLLGAGENSAPICADLLGTTLTGGVTLTTSNAKIAKIGKNNAIIGVCRGSAVITAQSYNGKTAEIAVTVQNKPASVSLSAKTLLLDAGETAPLDVIFCKNQFGSCTFASNHPEIAQVDAAGNITALAPGKAKITAKTYNGKKAVCAVTVIAPAESVNLPDSLTLGMGDSFTVCAYTAAGDAYAGPVSVSASDPELFRISSTKISGIALGTASVTVQAGGFTRTCSAAVTPYCDLHAVLAVAHRGGSGYWPENTLEAFANAGSTGADSIELDVHSTSDGIQVVNHNADITDANGKKYTISKTKYAKLKAIKPDLCTLEEAVQLISETELNLVLEMKKDANAAKCVNIIQKYGMKERVTYISFHTNLLSKTRSADKTAKLGLLLSEAAENLLQTAAKYGVSAVMPGIALVTEKLVNELHLAGYQVGVWTVNTLADAQQMRRMGVDMIVSDYPDLAVQVK